MPQRLPNPDFIAELTSIPEEGVLKAFHNTNLFESFYSGNESHVLNRTPLVNAQYGNLFAYMHRRFGMPNIAGDPCKDLTAGWLLNTPHTEVLLLVKPSLSGPFFSFTPMILCANTHPAPRELSESMLPAYNDAIETTLVDLLRPVGVRDQRLNALGPVTDSDELTAIDHNEEPLYEVKALESIAYPDPSRLFGSRDNAQLNLAMKVLGKGDAFAGRKLTYTLVKEALVKQCSEETPLFVALVLSALQYYKSEQRDNLRDTLRRHSEHSTWSHIAKLEGQILASLNLEEGGYDLATLDKTALKPVELFLSANGVSNDFYFDIEKANYNLRLMHHANKLVPLVNDGPTPEDEIAPVFDLENDLGMKRVEPAWLESVTRANRDDLLEWHRNLMDTEKNGESIFLDIMMRWEKSREDEEKPQPNDE